MLIRVSAPICFQDIKGQEPAKRAIEIAAAGNHSVLLVGPTGCGKTWLTQAAMGIWTTSDRRLYDDLDVVLQCCDSADAALDARRKMDAGSVIATATDISKIPEALRDRFLITIEMYRLTAADLLLPPPMETSAAISDRIAKAADIAPAGLTADALRLAREWAEKTGATARAYENAIRVAYTIARLDKAYTIGRIHVAEALSYAPRVVSKESAA